MRTRVSEAVVAMGLGEADRARVAAAFERLDAVLEPVVGEFFAHLRDGPHARHLAGIDLDRLRRLQSSHWRRLFTDGIDDGYAARVTRVGLVHRERRIPDEVFTLSYGWFAARLAARLVEASPNAPAETADLVKTVLELMFLDMTMATGAYDAALLD